MEAIIATLAFLVFALVIVYLGTRKHQPHH